MSLFTSVRERRLWRWTAAVLVAIYSALGPAIELVETLRAHRAQLDKLQQHPSEQEPELQSWAKQVRDTRRESEESLASPRQVRDDGPPRA